MVLGCNYYCDMLYLLPYFFNVPPQAKASASEEASSTGTNGVISANTGYGEASLLDLYSG